MATIRYTTYRFSRPPEIMEYEFVELKELLKRDKSINLCPKSSFLETFKTDLIFFSVAIVGALLTLPDIEWLNLIGGFAMLIGFFSLFSFVPSFFSYLSFLSSKALYYRRLKKHIINSDTYKDFQANRI
jgi:hypothetical protein